MYTIRRYRTLEVGAEISLELDGVALGTLEPCDTIRAQTRNSIYEIYMLDPGSGRALIRGGEYFAEPREATVSGSTFGGCMLKVGWLGVGLPMEIYTNGQRTVTSPVRSLRVERIDFAADQIDSIESRHAEACAPAGH